MSDLSSVESSKSSSSPMLLLLSIKKLPRIFTKMPKLFKKFEGNFLTGILIGAIFSLVVNLITNQVGEEIAKQKVQEALEIELVNQHLLANNIISEYNKGNYKKSNFYYYTSHRFDNYIWRSLGSTTFFYSLPSQIQAKLLTHYSVYIDSTNTLYANYDNVINDYETKYTICVFDNKACDAERVINNKVVDFYSYWQANYATTIDKDVSSILQDFHPTKDRLNNPLLRLLMGSKALPILVLPPKK